MNQRSCYAGRYTAPGPRRPTEHRAEKAHTQSPRASRRRKPGGLWLLTLIPVLLLGGYLGYLLADTGLPEQRPAAQVHHTVTITGVRDLEIYAGDPVSYLTGVTAADEAGAAVSVSVDSTGADLSRPGTYEIRYIAGDTVQTAGIRVLPREAGFLSMEQIDETVDRMLALILDGVTEPKAQAERIYQWARREIKYSGHSDRTDYRQTGVKIITDQRSGDCFGYFAVTKLLLDAAGIPNIDVQKVRNFPDDSDHFWSLVSVDGGKTYYHFDATPRVGDGDDFCLVTDAFLDAYSAANKGSHNRDKSLYPATPEE